jgi:ssDNA-binding replication factor A large subunit
MTDGRIRVEISFDGGQAMAVLVPAETADELERVLAASQEGSFMLEAEDGRYTIALRRVVYVKRFARESRVGFGGA